MNKSYIFTVVALLVGYASGSIIEKRRTVVPEDEPVAAKQADAVKVDSAAPLNQEAELGSAAMLAEVKAEADESWVRVNELTASLDNARAEIERQQAKIAGLEQQLAAAAGNRPERTRESWSERVERMKKENPEGYEAMQKARTEFQQRMEGAIADKSAFLVNIDTSSMSEEDLKNHEELLARIAEGWDMMKQVTEGGISGREQMEAMRDNYNAVRKLYEKERDIVLRQVGESIGYDKQGASEFSAYIQEVFEKTSPRIPFGHTPGGSGRSERQHGDGKSLR